jgi:outer membrane murein-binding lipoprotein Lpp
MNDIESLDPIPVSVCQAAAIEVLTAEVAKLRGEVEAAKKELGPFVSLVRDMRRWHDGCPAETILARKTAQAIQSEVAALSAQLAAAERERDAARKAINEFGNNPNGFDWAFLTKMESLEARNAALEGLLREASEIFCGRCYDAHNDWHRQCDDACGCACHRIAAQLGATQ